MPRSKAPPTKRARADPPPALDEASLQRAADDALVQTWSARISSGDVTTLDTTTAPSVDGLRLLPLPPADFATFQSLHRTIREKLHGSLTGWGGRDDTSGRERGYGYLPGSELAARHRAASHSMKEYSGAQATADADANRAASMMLDAAGALRLRWRARSAARGVAARCPPICAGAAARSAGRRAAQRTRRAEIPAADLDEPLHDSFGVIIVTVSVAGGSRILLQSRPDAARRRDYASKWRKGARRSERRAEHVPARCARRRWRRESLNMRFGLHSAERGAVQRVGRD